MSLKLPPQTHRARQLFDLETLAQLASRPGDLPNLNAARQAAKAQMVADKAVKRVTSLVLRANGELHLITYRRVDCGVQFSKVWNFGKLA